ncbi:hypothetical protein HOF17_01935 [Candidatus Peribacteria bacterium]|jgi:hypothetical protein|nr:hypothetical protein [Candidatus Peribacteria bacterium]
MSFKDDKKRKEKISRSSPDYFRQDKNPDSEKHAKRVEARDGLDTIRLDRLKDKIDVSKEKSKPEQDKKRQIIDSQEGNDSPDDFVDKQGEREAERQSAIRHGEPRQNKDVG